MMGYYALDKEGCFTDNSPYRDAESAISEAREIHGKRYNPKKHVEEHATDVFDEGYDEFFT